MTVNEFREKFNYAPYDMEEFATIAARVVDDDQLRDAGMAYLSALNELESSLLARNIFIG